MAKQSTTQAPASVTAPASQDDAPTQETASEDALSLKARIAQLEAELTAAKTSVFPSTPFLVSEDLTARPLAGPVHPVTGEPLFNGNHPTRKVK